MDKDVTDKGGRPNTQYFKLFEQVPRDGEWYVVKEYTHGQSAYEAARLVKQGKRPVPAGVACWEVVGQKMSREERRDRKGGGKGKEDEVLSVLWARWVGPKRKREARGK